MTSHTSPIQRALDDASWLTSSLPIKLFGNPILTTPCQTITSAEITSGQAQRWADQLTDFLTDFRAHTGTGRGLAANQVGIPKQMVLVLLDSGPEIYINPKVTRTEGEAAYPESCISGASLFYGQVVRPWKATIEFSTLEGNESSLQADPIHTRILLHEIDHLHGKVCSDLYATGSLTMHTGNADDLLGHELKRIN
jgi:peptide deformylase